MENVQGKARVSSYFFLQVHKFQSHHGIVTGVIAAGALSPPEHVTVAGGLPTTPVSSAATLKTPKTMSAKKGNKKNVWVPGKPLTPKAREMMESGKGSMNQDGRWTCVECNRSLSNEWTLEQHIQVKITN